jgi:elongation factor P
MQVNGLYLNGKFFTITIPVKIKMKVKSTVPGIKGDTVSNLTKPATLENGMEIKVPLFINEGDEIIIDTRTCEYVQRA